jgi:ribosomal protein L37E
MEAGPWGSGMEGMTMRCKRCGHETAETDKFCAECGM